MRKRHTQIITCAIAGAMAMSCFTPAMAKSLYVNAGPGANAQEAEAQAGNGNEGSGQEAETSSQETAAGTQGENPSESQDGNNSQEPAAGEQGGDGSSETAAEGQGENPSSGETAAPPAAQGRAVAAEGQEFRATSVARVENTSESHKTGETTYNQDGLTYKQVSFPGLNLTMRMGGGGKITNIVLTLQNMSGNIGYDACVNNGGWQPWTFNDQPTGGMEDSTYLEGLRIIPREVLERQYDVYYAVTMSGLGKLGYAKNGEMAGAPGRGEYVTDIDIVLVQKGGAAPGSTANAYWAPFEDSFYNADGVIKYKDAAYHGWLESGDYRYFVQGGQVLTGWQYIDGYKFYFAESGRLVQDVDAILGKQSSYLIKINKLMNCLTVYAPDGSNGYIIPVKAMLTSVGDDTPEGSFQTPEKYRWRQMVTGAYAQYATRIKPNAGFLLHSVIFDVPNNNTLWTDTYNALGVARSLGCVRLTTGNAKWIYDNCKVGSTITVYNDPIPSPFQKPGTVPIPSTQTWDPTDPEA